MFRFLYPPLRVEVPVKVKTLKRNAKDTYKSGQMKFYLMKYTFSILLTLILFQLVFFLSAIGQPRLETMTLKLQLVPYLGAGPIFIGEEEGFFREQAIRIEYIQMVRSADGIPALTQSKLDILYGSMSPAYLNAMARGAKIKFVVGNAYLSPTGCPYNALLARRILVEEGKLRTPTQLRGRKINVYPVSIQAYALEKLLNTVGLSLDDIEITDIPNPVMPEALEKGTIDLAVGTEPWITRTVEAGHAVIWIPTQQVIPNAQFTSVLYGPNLLEKNPEVGKRFMVAYLKGVRQYNHGKTERNLEIMTKHTGFDRELLKKACWPSIRNDGKIHIESTLDFQSWAVKKRYLEKVVTPDQFWDSRFVEFANKVLGGSTK